jgi:predicted O-methyltransferase YrrM
MDRRVVNRLESLLGRPLGHLTPRYVLDRSRVFAHERLHPREPWLVGATVALLGELLRTEDRGLEYGSGRSTAWFAARTRRLTSVEHSPDWHRRVANALRITGCRNVRHLLVPADERMAGDSWRMAYVSARGETASARYDYVLVDGIYRDLCAVSAVRVLRPGGLLILDNAQLYLPAVTRSPGRIPRPASAIWKRFVSAISSWRRIWLSNGVQDTSIWIKP